MLTEEQLRRICTKPDLPEGHLGTLPDTYQWAPVLRGGRKHMAVAARVMGLEFCPGAIFTGPEGNGRHTTAYALAKTLCTDRDGYRSLISIHGDDLNFEDREDVYAVVSQLTKVAKVTTALVVILDRPDLSEHNHLIQRTLLRLQKAMQAENMKLYLIVIAPSAEDLCEQMLSSFPLYHCPCPDRDMVKKQIKTMLKKPVPISIEGITDKDLINAADGLSWKQLKDLHQNLLRLTVLHYALNKKKYDAKGLTEEQVYQEGHAKLSRSDVQKVLDSMSQQRQTGAVATYYGGPAMQMSVSRSGGTMDLDPADIADVKDDLDSIGVDTFTQLINSMHHLIAEDDGSSDDLF